MLIISGAVYGSHSFRLCTIVFTLFDSPKSHNFTREKSERKTRILSSFTSRWQISLFQKKERNILAEWFQQSNLWRSFLYLECMYSIAAAICLATRFAWSSPMPLSETFDVKSPIKTSRSWTRVKNEKFLCRFVDYQAKFLLAYLVAHILG